MTIQTDQSGATPADDIRQLETPADTTEPNVETRERSPEPAERAEEHKPAIEYGSRADRKRQEINERLQRREEDRGARIERDDDTERMMGGRNLQTRADREAAEAAVEAQDASDISPDNLPEPRRIRLKVNGVEGEYDEDQVREYAQVALASQNILNDAKSIKEREKAALQAAEDRLAAVERLLANHSQSNQQQPAPVTAPAEDTKPATDDELDEIIDRIQTGDLKDAANALRKFGAQILEKAKADVGDIRQTVTATIRQQQESARVHNETQEVIKAFAAENGDFASSERRMNVLFDETVDVMRESLAELNVRDETIAAISRKFGVAPQYAVGMAVRMLRENGYDLPDNAAMMRSAARRVRETFNLPDPAVRRDPAPVVDQTQSILAEREARKQAMAPQPRRANVTPGLDLGPAKSKEDLARDHIRAVKVSRRRY